MWRVPGKVPKPVTWGIEQAGTARLQQVAFAADAGKALPRLPSSRQGEIVIDVLVAYTRKAARHYYEIERDVIELAVEEANDSFRLSGIGHVRLEARACVPDRLRRAWCSFRPPLAHGRQGRRAHGSHPRPARGLPGRRRDPDRRRRQGLRACDPHRRRSDADEAFAVVHHGCAVSSYTLAHEVGHIMEARHELAYVSGTTWRDIMSYKDACDGCPRLPVWSNPLVRIGVEPAGTTELNNARIIADNARRVASFK